MIGQWLADLEEEVVSSLRLELEDRGDGCVGHAYIFYPNANLPGFLFEIRLPKAPPYRASLRTIYLYSSGGIMSDSDRAAAEKLLAEKHGRTPPDSVQVEFSMVGDRLKVDWRGDQERAGSILLEKSDASGDSELPSRLDLKTWGEFREWAVSQRPRNYIFRGQRSPRKLVTSFHRTWRNDLRSWIMDDVSLLFGAVAERLSYPLQIGNLQHNAAIWSILQHHGYPTPMLDWSFSPFVAAYFAFEAADGRSHPRIHIFDQSRWNERYGKAHFIVDAAPAQLVVLESMGVANPRHGPQQAISTVTNVTDVEAFVRRKEQEDGVNYLTVCDLPSESRPQIMRELELMGITYGSLFPGLDGVCRDMRDRLFALPDQR